MDLELIRKRCEGGLFVITSRTSPRAPSTLPRRAPGARLGFAGNRAAPRATLHRAPWELSVVLGEGTRESEAPGKRPAEAEKKVTENAVLAKTVHPATLRPIKTFKIQPEGGEEKSPFWVIASP